MEITPRSTLSRGRFLISTEKARENTPTAGEVITKAILHTTAMIAPLLVGVGFPSIGSAQVTTPPATASAMRIEEVVVMARRVSENLQTVPVAVTAFSAADVEKFGIVRLNDLQFTTPSLTMQNHAVSDNFAAQAAMRGVVNSAIQLSVAMPIATYVDGVYNGSVYGLVSSSFYDIERVEVLKGPQGTLFGQNSVAGAIAVYNKLPKHEFEGEVGVGAGQYGQFAAKGMLNVPLVKDKLALRTVGTFTKDDGYGRELRTDTPLGRIELWSVRGMLRYNPNDDLQMVLQGTVTDGRSNGPPSRTVYVQPGSAANAVIAMELFGPSAVSPARSGTTLPAALAALNAQNQSNRFYDQNFNPHLWGDRLYSNFKRSSAALTIDYDFHFAELKSITGFDKFESNRVIGNGDIGRILSYLILTSSEQFSQEVQLSGTVFNDRLKYTVGAYYYRQSGNDAFNVSAIPQLNPGSPTYSPAHIEVRNYAGYGQGTFAITPHLNLTAGARWTLVEKESDPSPTAPSGCQVPLALRVGGACVAHLTTSESKPSWTAGLDWSLASDMMVYGKVSSGHTAGGPQQRTTADPNTYLPYEPEEVVSYEIGGKADFMDHRLRVNLAAYYSDYTNIQRQVARAFPNSTGGTTFTTLLTNAAAGSIKGAEAEIKLVPFEHADLTFTGSYVDPKYDEFIDGGLDVSFERFVFVSNYQYSISGGYELPTRVGPLSTQLTWAWRSSYDLGPTDTPGATFRGAPGPGTPDEFRIQKAYGILNATVKLTIDDYDADVRFFITNITGKEYFTGGITSVNFGIGYSSFVPGDPRRWGFEVLKRF